MVGMLSNGQQSRLSTYQSSLFLLNVVDNTYAGRLYVPKAGSITGDITCNGDAIDSAAFVGTSVISFVDQSDMHEPFLTVRETLLFAAMCSMPVFSPKVGT